MKLYIALAIYERCPTGLLDDPNGLKAVLERAVEAGSFTLHELVSVRFSPHGVTACAVVGESHLTLHSWPEEGRLFVDIASCSDQRSVDRALATIADHLPGSRVARLERIVLDPLAPTKSTAGAVRTES